MTKEVLELIDQISEEIKKIPKKKNSKIEWDVKLGSDIAVFDPNLSYELTHYRPITETKGLDFRPEWFTVARDVKLETGKYCGYPLGTKKYHDFWVEEYDKCRNGLEVNGYRITGDHYFFLNYYLLPESLVEKTGLGRNKIFPAFLSKQYEYFHYIEMCELTGHDVLAVKSRGVGFSEIAASLGVGDYTVNRNVHCVYTAFALSHLDDVLEKAWYLLDNLNADTEGGMRHVRLKYNSDMYKKASKINKLREELPNSWGSDIEGRIVDNPRKLRGDRVDRLFFEEAGSNPVLKKTYLQGDALVSVLGNKIGTRFVWGTGGDGLYMGDLSDMFYNPTGFNILPYRHNHTKTGEYVLTGFFIPAYTFLTAPGYIDERGVTNIEKAKLYRTAKRNALLTDPKAYLIECAEYCFTPDEAFALEGDNIFNKVLLAELLTSIRLGNGPQIETGTLEYKFKDNKVVESNIEKVIFKQLLNGKVHILERPKEGEDGQVPSNLYVAGIDGIDMGQEDTSDYTKDPSNFCVVVLRRSFGTSPPTIVAYYKDRPNSIKEAHIMCLKLLMYYNAKAVLESTRISILQFFREKRCENKYLMRRPRSCLPDILSGRSKLFGAPGSESVIKHLLELIANYVEEYCGEIWFKEVIEELTRYSYENKRKFDIVAALGMCMLADEELMFVPAKIDTQANTFKLFGYWKDERGIRHYGVLPDNTKFVANIRQTAKTYDTDYYGYERLRVSYKESY